MGSIRHHAIVVTGYTTDSDLSDCRQKAIDIGMSVSEIVPSPMNGFASFFVAPDGSKEGWEDSNKGDAMRAEFVVYLDSADIYSYAELFYGDDEGKCKIVNHK